MEVIDRSFAGELFLTEMTHKCRAFRQRQLGERSTRSPNKPLLPQCPLCTVCAETELQLDLMGPDLPAHQRWGQDTPQPADRQRCF